MIDEMTPRLKIFLLCIFLSAASCKKDSGGNTPVPPQPPVPPPVVNTFSNPLLATGPDPWVIQKDNVYYYTHTLGNRSAIWRTEKMSELNNITPQNIWSAPATGQNSKNVWAPELHFIDNKWYAYYTAGATNDLATQRTFVLENSSTDPRIGTWIDKGKIADPAADFFAIDGTVFTHNGSNYFIWSGQASTLDATQRLYIARMLNPWTLETNRSLISSPQFPWESFGSPPAVNEAPQILKNPTGKTFLIYSASGCWTDEYGLGMLTLRDGGDPLVAADWTKAAQPVFAKNPSASVYGPGHNAFFKSKNGTEDWIIYHANPLPGQGCANNRSPRMQKYTWNADGTPNFGVPISTNTALAKPAGE